MISGPAALESRPMPYETAVPSERPCVSKSFGEYAYARAV